MNEYAGWTNDGGSGMIAAYFHLPLSIESPSTVGIIRWGTQTAWPSGNTQKLPAVLHALKSRPA